MKSCIYEGCVLHARRKPKHRFRFRLFMLLIDLEELPHLFVQRWLWSGRYPNIAWFRRQDHLGPSDSDLAQCIRDLVEERTGFRPHGPIRLLTNLRYFGFLMNPISVYYCLDPEDESVEFVIAEVTNTPWVERHCYVLDLRDQQASDRNCESRKSLHVSPFMSMDYRYRFAISRPAAKLQIQIQNYPLGDRAGSPDFMAILRMNRVPANRWNLARVLLRYPLVTLQIAMAIYWQALILRIKGATFFPHPDKPVDTTRELESTQQ